MRRKVLRMIPRQIHRRQRNSYPGAIAKEALDGSPNNEVSAARLQHGDGLLDGMQSLLFREAVWRSWCRRKAPAGQIPILVEAHGGMVLKIPIGGVAKDAGVGHVAGVEVNYRNLNPVQTAEFRLQAARIGRLARCLSAIAPGMIPTGTLNSRAIRAAIYRPIPIPSSSISGPAGTEIGWILADDATCWTASPESEEV